MTELYQVERVEDTSLTNEEAFDFVNHCLSGIYDEEGQEVVRWWHRPRRELDNQSPRQTWLEDRDAVIRLAFDDSVNLGR